MLYVKKAELLAKTKTKKNSSLIKEQNEKPLKN